MGLKIVLIVEKNACEIRRIVEKTHLQQRQMFDTIAAGRL